LIAGGASVGIEILQDLPNVDIVMVCVDGGGTYFRSYRYGKGCRTISIGEQDLIDGMKFMAVNRQHIVKPSGAAAVSAILKQQSYRRGYRKEYFIP